MLAPLLTLALVALPVIRDIDGPSQSPLAHFKGKVAVAVFVSHDCPICNTYAPEICRLAERFRKRGVQFAVVYAERMLSKHDAAEHAHAYSYDGLALFRDPTGWFSRSVGARITPEAAVFDTSGHRTYLGRIDDRYVSFGQQRAKIGSHDLSDAIAATLNHKPVNSPRTTAIGCFIASNP